MNYGKWVVGGVIGGAVGAAVWAAITYFTSREIGWIAWGVGFVVGLGVRVAAGNESGFAPGITAAVLAVFALVVGKYAAVTLIVNKMNVNLPAMAVTADDMIVRKANEIVEERKTK